MRWLLTFIFFVAGSALAQSAESVNSHVGLHLLSTEWPDQKYTYISSNPSEEDIVELMNKLNWVDGFHQVVLTTSANISMEVSGSMHPDHGLSAAYRVLDKKIYSVTSHPPTNAGQMTQILTLFLKGDDSWKTLYDFKNYEY